MNDFLETMEQSTVADAARSAPQPIRTPAPDWYAWRKRNYDVGIAKTGEEGSLEHWQQLLRTEGADKLTSAVIKARGTGRKGERIWYSRVLEYLAGEPEADAPADPKAASRSREDLLIWCITHSGKCFADALYPWTPLPDDDTAPIRTPFGRVKRIPMADPLTPERREKIEAMANRARKELLIQCGMPDEKRYNVALYEAVRATPRLVAWLRGQRLLPAQTTSTKE